MHASAQQVVHRLGQVDSEVQQFFMPAARLILSSEQPELRMAAALAALSGRTEVPQPRSLLTLVRCCALNRVWYWYLLETTLVVMYTRVVHVLTHSAHIVRTYQRY